MATTYWLAAEADGIAAPVLPMAPDPLLVEPIVLGDEALASGVAGIVDVVEPVLLPPVVVEPPDMPEFGVPEVVPDVSASRF